MAYSFSATLVSLPPYDTLNILQLPCSMLLLRFSFNRVGDGDSIVAVSQHFLLYRVSFTSCSVRLRHPILPLLPPRTSQVANLVSTDRATHLG